MGGGARARAPHVLTRRPSAPPSPVIRLRRAEEGDLDAIVAIERLSFGDPWPRGAFLSLVRRADADVVVAVRGPGPGSDPSSDPSSDPGSDPSSDPGDAVVGYAITWFIVGEGEVGNVAVHPDARGLGIGARLLDEALAEAGRREAAVVFLEVRESNDAARRLYASRGFVEVGRRRRYYRRPVEDALVMRWDRGSPA